MACRVICLVPVHCTWTVQAGTRQQSAVVSGPRTRLSEAAGLYLRQMKLSPCNRIGVKLPSLTAALVCFAEAASGRLDQFWCRRCRGC
ncbi:hypothetical protein V8C40DRAFT_124804 [Trichoderma camerunense]